MTELTVVTGFSELGWMEYGQRMVRTFDEFWPVGADLYYFHDGPEGADIGSKRCRIRGLPYGDVQDWVAFETRYRGVALVNGRSPTSEWRMKERVAGYSFRTDAYKFARVPLAMHWFCREVADTPYVVWFDGDTVFFRPVPMADELIATLFPDRAEVSYLGRPGAHSEIGYVGYRLPGALVFLDGWSGFYSRDTFRDMDETHSAHTFDLARRRTGDRVRFHDLTPEGRGHVWMQSPLVAFSDHLKGERKARGYSPEHPNKGEVKHA